MTPDLVDLLEDSGLTGRGGAGFGTAVKVRAAVSAGASLIVNGCDGEYARSRTPTSSRIISTSWPTVRTCWAATASGMPPIVAAAPSHSSARPASTPCRSRSATSRRRRAPWCPWPTAVWLDP